MIKVNIGERIKSARKNAGLTQRELGEKLGVSEKTVSSWEINRTEPSMGTLEKIAKVLDINKSDLLDIEKQLQVVDFFSGLGSLLKYADVFAGPNHVDISVGKNKNHIELELITKNFSESQIERLIKYAKLIQKGEL